ncbi:autotransporter assembly complex family protein [Noviherbaspirillum sp. UKPF54]|uniref:autotransporter assembly complex protein TamA n=1 Tax=Noviherbaspirillum sp. UKPF54 TaxID=2601898 RepID=UPI0011B1A6DF|nr:autotransporter assembly complex family protein [Noviherbaspirillum sp. UKPF54]QDZ27921.1 outer membrane protein assembly factor [Noviherbaspirillum sp. UKPF54]
MRPWRSVSVLPWLACLLLYAGNAAGAAYRVELDAPSSLKDLLKRHLDLLRYQERDDLNEDQLNFMLETVEAQVAKLTSTEGYFLPRTTVSVDRGGARPVVRLKVESGARTSVANVDVQVAGAASARSPAQAARVRRNWQLAPGEPFRQEDWDAAKQAGLQILQRRRYPAARIAESGARIYPDLQQADLSVRYDSGPLFTLGPLQISGTRRYPESIIRNVNPLAEGEEYSAERLLELQREIQRTPYFSNVVIDVDKDPARAQQAPVRVQVTEFPAQRLRAGVGYSTDTGAHVEGRYSHLNLFGRAWVLDTQLRLEQRRQLGAVELAMPPGSGGWVDSAHASIDRTTLEGIDLRSRRIGLRRARNTEKRDFAYTLEYYSDQLQQLNGATPPPDTVVEPGTQRALVAGAALTRRQIDNPRFPRRGYIASLELGAAFQGLLTDQTFFRAYSQLRQYNPIGRRDVVILRGELGAVVTKGGNAAIPASLLFRAGGTDSVRGYRYQSIGNERNGTVYPTRYLVTGGAEYQRWFSEKWGAAVFYDVGAASDSWSGKNFFHAVGVGARYRSPIGPINADLAYGFQGGNIRPHLSLGIVF